MKIVAHKQQSFTTSLSPTLIRELDEVSQELKIHKNEIIGRAFTLWNKKRKQILLAESYKNAKNDTAFMALADEGIADWDEHIPK